MAKGIAALALAFAALGLARAETGSRIVKIVVAGPHAPEGVATEVVLPPGWQPRQPALLMVFLHDGWGSEKSFRKHDLAAVALGMMQGSAIRPVVIARPPSAARGP
jgi:hypothetical protein